MSRPTVRVATVGNVRYVEVRRKHFASMMFTVPEAIDLANGLIDAAEELEEEVNRHG